MLISRYAIRWIILSNLGLGKPAQEVLFSRKTKVHIHPTIFKRPNNIHFERASYQKNLLLDEKLSFKHHVDYAILNVKKGILVKTKLRNIFATEVFSSNMQSFFEAPN